MYFSSFEVIVLLLDGKVMTFVLNPLIKFQEIVKDWNATDSFAFECVLEQDKSSDIEQQPPFGDRKISNIQPQNRWGGSKPIGTSYNFDKV